MRLSNLVLDTTTKTLIVGESEVLADGVDPSSRQIENDVYPLPNDVKVDNIHLFQGGTITLDYSVATQPQPNIAISGPVSLENSVNNTGALKMTGSLSAIPDLTGAGRFDPGTQPYYNILMVADSVFGG